MITGIENKMEEKKHGRKLNQKQIAAINLAKRLGKKIAQDYPQIAEDYRRGSTIKKIAENYGFAGEYRLITGKNTWNCLVSALEILIPEEERQVLGRQHMQMTGKKGYEESKGIFSLRVEELGEARRKGGLISGRINGREVYKEKKGIHAQSKEEKRKFGKIGILAQGRKPFSDNEKIYFFELCESLEYQYKFGRQKGKPNYRSVSEGLERKFGIKRSVITLTSLMSKSKKEEK